MTARQTPRLLERFLFDGVVFLCDTEVACEMMHASVLFDSISEGVEMPATTVFRHNIVSGIWKFPPDVKEDDIVTLAKEWRDGPDGDRYLRLYIRPCSRNELGLGFEYRFDGRTHKHYFHKTAAALIERFGEKVTWDMGSGTTFIGCRPADDPSEPAYARTLT